MKRDEERFERGQTIKHVRWKGSEGVRTKLMKEREMKGD